MDTKILISGLAGLALVGGIGFAWSSSRTDDSWENAERQAAQTLNVPVEDYRRTTNMVDQLKGKRGAISDDDWSYLVEQVNGPSIDLRRSALVAMAQIDSESPHGAKAIEYANDYLAEGHAEGNVGPILVLRKFGDDSWRDHAERLAADENEAVAAIGTKLLDSGDYVQPPAPQVGD